MRMIRLWRPVPHIAGRTTIGRRSRSKKEKTGAARIDEDFVRRRAVIRESVNKIIITDNGIEMQCIGDYDMIGGATQI